MHEKILLVIVTCTFTVDTIFVSSSSANRQVALVSPLLITNQLKGQTQDSNPYLYPCTTNSQCPLSDNIQSCVTSAGPDSSYWYCDCHCGNVKNDCTQNSDCCTNICNNGTCSSSGGTQGTVCNAGCPTQCADGYVCQPWGESGYCDSINPANDNPYLYPCKTDSQCSNQFHKCAQVGPNSTYWFCACYCGGGPCNRNEDCCTNICDNGACSSVGGKQGCVCGGNCPYEEQCDPGYTCQKWGEFGYCDSTASFTVSSSPEPSTTNNYPVCPGYACISPTNCSSNPNCACFKTSNGEGFCSEPTSCEEPDCTNCPSSTSVCVVESCCNRPICVPLSSGAACTEPPTGIIHKSDKIFSLKHSRKTAAENFQSP